MNYLSINVGYDPVPWSTAIRAIADYTKGIGARPDIILCPTFADVQRAWRNGKMAVTYDLEGMGALNGDLSMVELYYRLGVRQMLIAYNLNNDAGGGQSSPRSFIARYEAPSKGRSGECSRCARLARGDPVTRYRTI